MDMVIMAESEKVLQHNVETMEKALSKHRLKVNWANKTTK